MLAPLREMGLVAARRWFVVEQSVKLFANRLGDENDRRVEVNLLGGDSFEKLAVPELPTPHDIGNNYIVADGEHARFGENTDCATKRDRSQLLDHVFHSGNPLSLSRKNSTALILATFAARKNKRSRIFCSFYVFL